MTIAISAAQATNAGRLHGPTSAKTREGRPKIPAPIVPLIINASRSQRRMPRTSAGRAARSAAVALIECFGSKRKAPDPVARGSGEKVRPAHGQCVDARVGKTTAHGGPGPAAIDRLVDAGPVQRGEPHSRGDGEIVDDWILGQAAVALGPRETAVARTEHAASIQSGHDHGTVDGEGVEFAKGKWTAGHPAVAAVGEVIHGVAHPREHPNRA